MARPRNVGRPRAQKTRYNWQFSSGSFSALAAGNTALQFSAVGALSTTLLRIRGEITGYVDAAQAPGGLIQVNYGIILVEDGAGTGSRWTPVDDATAPWLLYGTAILGYEEMVTDVIDVPGITSFRHVIDNKAMRVIRPDQELQFVVENTTVFTAMPLNMAYSLRWLQSTGKR